ncbi:hypothetical protein FZC66_07485 [Priestia megaterium]|nr:hypothetical protein FZC66_07485 [Priestia megaterium]
MTASNKIKLSPATDETKKEFPHIYVMLIVIIALMTVATYLITVVSMNVLKERMESASVSGLEMQSAGLKLVILTKKQLGI